MTKTAREILRMEYGTSPNFMTPTVLKVGMINPNVAYELSTGRGLFDQDLFGVSVVTYFPSTDTTDRHAIESKSFQSIDAAEGYISGLIRNHS